VDTLILKILRSLFMQDTYQPQVTINKPERAIGRDVTTNLSFTMILIDLNGDGELMMSLLQVRIG
jgi:hypothetical protein